MAKKCIAEVGNCDESYAFREAVLWGLADTSDREDNGGQFREDNSVEHEV